ncbi:hypothetical protein CAPTEDRAFT_211802 [Capitella teleta]|uniref:Methyltransferase domain-containing protein n=1 Tax=Capitella teleta TaxID=283909 RepID=R7T9U9_CAPTE|nr:hypothetical protein CAPTEDRAFT_211802 [Capitella teleta]|eukprot:ELT87779.1 hypothetical protein CAPTEDRAFT_211802 [Capitella teleta]
MPKVKSYRVEFALFFVVFVLYIFAVISPKHSQDLAFKMSAKRHSVKWAKRLDFIPIAGQQTCKDAMEKIGSEVWTEEYLKTSKAHGEFLKTLNDSQNALNAGDFVDQQKMLAKLASLLPVQTVCESGLNAGHNALIWLTAKKTTRVISFDQGKRSYTREAAKFLQKEYPTRFNVTWGDSTSTLLKYQRDHADFKCDVIFVDSESTAKSGESDASIFRLMAKDGHLFIFGGYPTRSAWLNKQRGPVWDTRKRDGEIAELFACVEGGFQGFSFGYFIL